MKRLRAGGAGWGESGYGWLPYEYLMRGLAEDFWSVLKKEWVDTGEFSLPISRRLYVSIM
jgi:C1A family cysteine protease